MPTKPSVFQTLDKIEQHQPFAQHLLKEKIKQIVEDNFEKVSFLTSETIQLENDIESILYTVPDKYIENARQYFKQTLSQYIPTNCKCFLAGGSVSTYLLFQNPFFINDYDIFVQSTEDLKSLKKHLSAKGFICRQNKNAYHFDNELIKIDVIKQPFNKIETIFENFDFNVCKFGFTIHDDYKFAKHCRYNQLFNLQLKLADNRLIKLNKKDAIKVLSRIFKYLKKGYTFSSHSLEQLYTGLLFMFENKEININSPEWGSMAEIHSNILNEDYPELINDAVEIENELNASNTIINPEPIIESSKKPIITSTPKEIEISKSLPSYISYFLTVFLLFL